MRPRSLDELLGQPQILAPGRSLRAAIDRGRPGSLILFGPPGVGKTSLALLIAERSGLQFRPFSAVLSGIKEVREAMAEAEQERQRSGRGTLLFVDEIHRFNKAQQDAFLPFVERGQIVLIGATTENPSFAVIAPLLSRCRIVRLQPLDDESIRKILADALHDPERGLGARRLRLGDAARERIVRHAAGDARRALTVLEAAAALVGDGTELSEALVVDAMQQRTLVHDKGGDFHYDLLSAFHKSLRNSDVQAAVYWLARFLAAEGDPLPVARRMVAMAAEDIGLADPMALQVATAALHSVLQLGLPEGRLPLCAAAVYLAGAPKSNAVVRAIDAAMDEVEHGEPWPVPEALRNPVTRSAREAGHGKGYRYAHDEPGGVAPLECLPAPLVGRRFFEPSETGFEKRLAERMAEADRLRRPS
jgi:putative ATPase